MSEKTFPLPSWINYLCIEGVIGAGKTSLCTLIGRQSNARLVLENAEENPFLEKFYGNRQSYAFQTQLWFLVSRYQQLSAIVTQQDLFYRFTLSDYIFHKDRIFASINLSDEEMKLYEQVAPVMESNLPRPDLVVYLQTSTDVLMRRIESRGRSYEFNMDSRYISMINEAYNHFFFHYRDTPLLIINTDELDFVNNQEDFEEIANQIEHAGKGASFYHPMSASDKEKIGGDVFSRKPDPIVSDDTTIEALGSDV